MKQVSHTLTMLEQDRSWSEEGFCASSPTLHLFPWTIQAVVAGEEPNITTDDKDLKPPGLI